MMIEPNSVHQYIYTVFGIRPVRNTVRLDEVRELPVRREIEHQTPRHVESRGSVAFTDQHLPERKPGFSTRVEIGTGRGRLPHCLECLPPVAPAHEPFGASRHPGSNDVIDPCTRNPRPNVVRIATNHTVKGSSRLPELTPPSLPTERPKMQPHVVQVDFAKEVE